MVLAGTHPINGPNSRPLRSWQDRAPEQLFFPRIHESPRLCISPFPVCALHRGPRIQSRFRTHGKNDMTPPNAPQPSNCCTCEAGLPQHPSLSCIAGFSDLLRLLSPNTKQPRHWTWSKHWQRYCYFWISWLPSADAQLVTGEIQQNVTQQDGTDPAPLPPLSSHGNGSPEMSAVSVSALCT